MSMTDAKNVVTYVMGMTGTINKLCRVVQKLYLCYWMLVEIVNFALSTVAFLVPRCHQVHIGLNRIPHISHNFSWSIWH